MKTIDNLLGNEGINAAAVLALSGTLMVLVAKGNGPLSLRRSQKTVNFGGIGVAVTEKQLGWAGLILAVVGIILSVAALARESIAVGVIALALVLIALVALFFMYRSSRRLGQATKALEEPPITLRDIQKVIRFEDAAATRAAYTDTRTVKVNHETEPTHYWFKNLVPKEKMALHQKSLLNQKLYV